MTDKIKNEVQLMNVAGFVTIISIVGFAAAGCSIAKIQESGRNIAGVPADLKIRHLSARTITSLGTSVKGRCKIRISPTVKDTTVEARFFHEAKDHGNYELTYVIPNSLWQTYLEDKNAWEGRDLRLLDANLKFDLPRGWLGPGGDKAVATLSYGLGDKVMLKMLEAVRDNRSANRSSLALIRYSSKDKPVIDFEIQFIQSDGSFSPPYTCSNLEEMAD